MSLIHCDGFDTYGVANNSMSTTGTLSSGGMTNVSGTYSALTRTGIGMSLDLNGYGHAQYSFNSEGDIFFGFAYYVPILDVSNIVRVQLDNFLGTISDKFRIASNVTGALTVYLTTANNQTLNLFSPVNSIYNNTWHYIEVHLKLSTGTDGIVEIHVDGDTVISYTGQTCASNPVGNIIYWGHAGWYAYDKYIDDFYIIANDNTGLTGFCGDCVVHSLVPISDAGPNQMVQTGGGQTHASAVSDVPSDEDTSYLESDTAGDTELFNLSTIPSDVIDVLAVEVVARVKKSGPGAATYQIGVQSNGVQSWSGVIYPTLNYLHKTAVFEKDPNTSQGWNKTTLQAAQVGFRVVS